MDLTNEILRAVIDAARQNIVAIQIKIQVPDTVEEVLSDEEIYHMLLMMHRLAKDQLRLKEEVVASRKMNETLRNDVKKLTEELKGR